MEWTTLALGLLVLNGIILVHELGHFLAARRMGLTVREFAIGFGPRLLSLTRGGRQYSLRLIPLGGYVLISELAPEPDEIPAPVGARFLALAAGPLANLALVALIMGPVKTLQAAVLWVSLMAGLLTGGTPRTEVEFVGPIGMSQLVGQAATVGSPALLQVVAFLSLNLALFNLLPLPGFDGGRMLALAIEKLSGGRRFAWEPVVQGVGVLLVLGFGLWVTGRELLSLLGWL